MAILNGSSHSTAEGCKVTRGENGDEKGEGEEKECNIALWHSIEL
jgi:hypothetical protein